jgi:hypothetical protein
MFFFKQFPNSRSTGPKFQNKQFVRHDSSIACNNGYLFRFSWTKRTSNFYTFWQFSETWNPPITSQNRYQLKNESRCQHIWLYNFHLGKSKLKKLQYSSRYDFVFENLHSDFAWAYLELNKYNDLTFFSTQRFIF